VSILRSAPPEAWFVLFGAVVGGLSAVLGAWITSRGSARQLRMQLDDQRNEQAKERTRQRHEQFYVDCRKYFSDIVCYFLPYQSAMRGDISFNTALDMTAKNGVPSGYDHNHVLMLVDFYFPEFKEEFDAIMETREQLNKIMSGFREQYSAGDTDGSKWLRLFQPEYEKLGQQMEAFEERIAGHRPPA